MSIFLYSGTPGSGKSLHQAENIYNRLRRGKPVVANYDVNLKAIPHAKGKFWYVPNDMLSPALLVAISNELFPRKRPKEGAIQLYIDEAQLLFNAREWSKPDRKAWLEFFTQHRKYGYDIFLIAQFDRMLDRQIRGVIEYEVKHRKVSNFGTIGLVLKLLTLGDCFVAITIWYDLKEKISSTFFHYHRRYSRLYDTYKIFNQGEKTEIYAGKRLKSG